MTTKVKKEKGLQHPKTHAVMIKHGMIARACVEHMDTKIATHEQQVTERIAIMRGFLRDDIKDLENFKGEIRSVMVELRSWQESTGSKISQMHEEVKAIGMVKLNGGEPVTLAEAMRELWVVTSGIRTRGKMSKAWHEWQQASGIGRFTTTVLGRWAVKVVLIFIIASILDFSGAVKIDIHALFTWVASLLTKGGTP